jgi:hypothetical protein
MTTKTKQKKSKNKIPTEDQIKENKPYYLAWQMMTKIIDKDKSASLDDSFESACILLKAIIESNGEDDRERADMSFYCMEMLERHLEHWLGICVDCGGPLDEEEGKEESCSN